MSKVEKLEREVQSLSPEELAEFRAWFADFDWQRWDRQIEKDAESGLLDALVERAVRDHGAGRSTEL